MLLTDTLAVSKWVYTSMDDRMQNKGGSKKKLKLLVIHEKNSWRDIIDQHRGGFA